MAVSAITLQTVLASIEDALTGMTPSYLPRKPFVNDGADAATLANEPATADRFRRFEVTFGKGTRGEICTQSEEEWVQPFTVSVVYPATENLRADELHIRQDADEIENALNDSANWSSVIHQDVIDVDAPVLDEQAKAWFLTVQVLVRFMKTT